MIFFLLNFPAPDSCTLKGGTGFKPVSLAGVSFARRRPVGSPTGRVRPIGGQDAQLPPSRDGR
jgi:hypothetical protein